MSAPSRLDPTRTCIGCRSRRPQRELVRVTRAPDGAVTVGGASSGRGAWLCRDQRDNSGDGVTGDPVSGVVDLSCLERAIAKRAFARAWRGDDVDADDLRLRLSADGA